MLAAGGGKGLDSASVVSGWASMIGVVFFAGVQLLFLGVLGRIYREVKRRPLYIIGSLLS